MPLTNVLLLSQAAGYSVTVVLSLCVIIPMIMHESAFKGHCLLFTTGTFVSGDGSFDPNWSSKFYCVFTLITGLNSLIISLAQVIRISIFLCKATDSNLFLAFVDAVVALYMVLLVIMSAIFVTRGFSTWCSAVTERFPLCEVASTELKIHNETDIDASGFFLEMGTVQFGIWTSLVFWVTLFLLAARKVFAFQERENIIISMARERLRYDTPSYEAVTDYH